MSELIDPPPCDRLLFYLVPRSPNDNQNFLFAFDFCVAVLQIVGFSFLCDVPHHGHSIPS